MGRRTTHSEIAERIARIRSAIPDCIIRTTLISGFPGEEEKDHKELLGFVSEIGFDRLGDFAYSKEEDTRSYDFDLQVEQEIMDDRYNRLMDLQNSIIKEKNENRIGQTYEVLVERYESLFDRYVARSIMSAPDGIDGVVYIKTDEVLNIGEFYNVQIKSYKDYDLFGIIIK